MYAIRSYYESLVIIGSHDITIDFISDIIPAASGHVGSMGGIMALKRGECHLAPIHLLDESTGEYNISYIKRFFKGERMALIRGLRREQGFIVPKGNPQQIEGFNDLTRRDISFVNRQKGSGTRLLFVITSYSIHYTKLYESIACSQSKQVEPGATS